MRWYCHQRYQICCEQARRYDTQDIRNTLLAIQEDSVRRRIGDAEGSTLRSNLEVLSRLQHLSQLPRAKVKAQESPPVELPGKNSRKHSAPRACFLSTDLSDLLESAQ